MWREGARDGIVDRSIIRDARPAACDRSEHDGNHGDGVAVYADRGMPADVTVRSTRIENSARAGVASFGADAAIDRAIVDGCGRAAISETDRGGIGAEVSATASRCDCGASSRPCEPDTQPLEPALVGGNGCGMFEEGVCLRTCLEEALDRGNNPQLDRTMPVTPVEGMTIWSPDELGIGTATTGEDGCLEWGGLPPQRDITWAYARDGSPRSPTPSYLPFVLQLHTGHTDSARGIIQVARDAVWGTTITTSDERPDPRQAGNVFVSICPPPAPGDITKAHCFGYGIEGSVVEAESGVDGPAVYITEDGLPDRDLEALTSYSVARFVNADPGWARLRIRPPSSGESIRCTTEIPGDSGWRVNRMVEPDVVELLTRPGFLAGGFLYCTVQ